MASSASFEHTAHLPAPKRVLPGRVHALARESTEFRLHRSLNRLSFSATDFLWSAALCGLTTSGWLLLLPSVCRLWRPLLEAGTGQLGLDANVILRPYTLWGFSAELPSIELVSLPPDLTTWWATALACVVLFLISYHLPERTTPLVYLLRFALAIQGSALAYFAAIPARFPHGAAEFIASTMAGGAVLILLVPAIFTLIYYVFDFGIYRKALLTLLTMAHLAVLVPLQALVYAYILKRSLLFMPLLFLLFGMPIEILVIVSFYSWGMSWKTRRRTCK